MAIWRYHSSNCFSFISADKCIENGACINGTCKNVPTEENERGYVCACEPGYIGENCENSNLQKLIHNLI